MVVPLALGFSIKAPNVVQQSAKPAPPPTPPAPSAATASTRTLIRDIASRRSRASTVLMHRQRDRLVPGVGNFSLGPGRTLPGGSVAAPPGTTFPPNSGWVDQAPPSGQAPGPSYPPLAPPQGSWFQPAERDPFTGTFAGANQDLVDRVSVNNNLSPWDVNYGVGPGGEVSYSPGGVLTPAGVADLLNRHDEYDLSMTENNIVDK